MLDYNNSVNNEDHPDYFETFDEALKKGIKPGYFEPDELCDIIDIYFSENKLNEGKFAVSHALSIYPQNEELLYEVLLLLNDYELWNDLLTLCETYSSLNLVWANGHKLTALLHLGMEEDAFQFFKKLKSTYAGNKENLSIIYQCMGESLYEVDLYDAAIEVIEEAIKLLGEDVDLLWIQLQSYVSLEDKESVIEIGTRIQNINPLNPETWNKLGTIYNEIGDLEKTIEAYEFAFSLGLNDYNALMNLIYAYKKNGNYAKALEKVVDYLHDHPDNYYVTLLAISLCYEMEEWEEGIKYTEKAISLAPQVESLYLHKCRFYLKMGENLKAIKALEEGITKTDDSEGELKKNLDTIKKTNS